MDRLPRRPTPLQAQMREAHPGIVYQLRYTPDGKRLFSVGGAPRLRGYLAIWNADDGKLLYGAEQRQGTLFALAVSADGKYLALALLRGGENCTALGVETSRWGGETRLGGEGLGVEANCGGILFPVRLPTFPYSTDQSAGVGGRARP